MGGEEGGSGGAGGGGGPRGRRLSEIMWERNPDRTLKLAARLNVTVEDFESDYEPEIKMKVQDISWEVTDLTRTSLTIEFTLNNPEVYALNDYLQYITVKAFFSDFEPGWNDEAILSRTLIPG